MRWGKKSHLRALLYTQPGWVNWTSSKSRKSGAGLFAALQGSDVGWYRHILLYSPPPQLSSLNTKNLSNIDFQIYLRTQLKLTPEKRLSGKIRGTWVPGCIWGATRCWFPQGQDFCADQGNQWGAEVILYPTLYPLPTIHQVLCPQFLSKERMDSCSTSRVFRSYSITHQNDV